MKKIFIALSLIGSITSSFTTYGMLHSFIRRIKQQLPTKASQQTTQTPDEYLPFISDWEISNWQHQKNILKSAIKNANNNPELIQTIVNHPETKDSRYVGQTPLCRATKMNDFEFVTFLLHNGANINDEIRGIYGNDPNKFSTQALFFARTYEMVQLLHNNGADITSYDTLSRGNILHMVARGRSTHDIRIFDYAISQGVNPNNPNKTENLWHSLLESIYTRSEKNLLDFAARLHDLTINPYHENASGENAIDIIEEHIKSNIEFLNSDNPFKLKNENIEKANDIAKFIRLRDNMITIKTEKFKEIKE